MDFLKYLRIFGKDIELLVLVGCDVIFMLFLEEVYFFGVDLVLLILLLDLVFGMEG